MNKSLSCIAAASLFCCSITQPVCLHAAQSAVAVAQPGQGGAMSQEEFEKLNERILQAAHKNANEQEAPTDATQVEPIATFKRMMDAVRGYAPDWLLAFLAAALLLAGTAYLRLRGRRGRHGRAAYQPRAVVQLEPQEAVTPLQPALAVAQSSPSPALAPARVPGIAVEQNDAIVDEAKVIVALGRIGNAIRMLNDHIDLHPHASVGAWLYLLELYRAAGNRRAFDDLGRRMHAAFNVMVPAWEAGKSSAVLPLNVEEFPHVMQHIIDGWGTPGCRDYLRNLLQDNREGERTGFSVEVFQEISLLLALLEHREKQ